MGSRLRLHCRECRRQATALCQQGCLPFLHFFFLCLCFLSLQRGGSRTVSHSCPPLATGTSWAPQLSSSAVH